MAKECDDILFLNKKLSDLTSKYIFVNFEYNTDINLSMERDMECGDANRYRVEPNYFFSKWTGVVQMEFNIVKNPSVYHSQDEQEISKDDIREISKWLTSSHFPEWLQCINNTENDTIRYKGWFNNIETWTIGGVVYGLKLSFKCTSPFGYTKDFINKKTVSIYDEMVIENNSDEIEDYCCPTIEIQPHSTGQIYICNLSDCKMLKSGTLTLTQTTYFDSLLDVIDNYALMNGYSVSYSGSGTYNINPLCNDTAVQFNLIDSYDNKMWCTAFFADDTKEYKIIESGFMYMSAYQDLKIYIDCKNFLINDEIGRMITYDKLGINDVGYMYWPRLLNGTNTFLLYGDCEFTIKHFESRKVGE